MQPGSGSGPRWYELLVTLGVVAMYATLGCNPLLPPEMQELKEGCYLVLAGLNSISPAWAGWLATRRWWEQRGRNAARRGWTAVCWTVVAIYRWCGVRWRWW
jgi:hypothetical protein